MRFAKLGALAVAGFLSGAQLSGVLNADDPARAEPPVIAEQRLGFTGVVRHSAEYNGYTAATTYEVTINKDGTWTRRVLKPGEDGYLMGHGDVPGSNPVGSIETFDGERFTVVLPNVYDLTVVPTDVRLEASKNLSPDEQSRLLAQLVADGKLDASDHVLVDGPVEGRAPSPGPLFESVVSSRAKAEGRSGTVRYTEEVSCAGEVPGSAACVRSNGDPDKAITSAAVSYDTQLTFTDGVPTKLTRRSSDGIVETWEIVR